MPQPAAVFGVIAQSGREIQALGVCSTIRPPRKELIVCVFSFNHPTKDICDAPTCTFHQNLFLGEWVTVPHQSKPFKCAQLSVWEKGPNAFFLTKHICDAPTCSFHQNLLFGRIGHSGSEVQALQVCSTIRQGKRAHCIFLTKHICDVPTCSFDQNLFLVESVTVPQRFKPSKCGQLSVREKGPTACFFDQAYL